MNSHSLDLEASSSQYASITDASQTGLDITGDLTIEAWVKLETLTGTDTNQLITGKWGASGDAVGYALVYQDISGTHYLSFWSANSGSSTTKNVAWTPVVGVWYHVAVTYDASAGSCKLYVNGLQQGSEQTGLPTSIGNNSQPYTIGVNYNGGTSVHYLDGLIDEVRVWDDIRTVTEIADNKDKEISGASANLQGYWRLNNDYTDETSNGNDLTASGSPVFSTDVPFSNPSFIISESLSLSESSTNLRGLVSTTNESLSVSETISALKGISFTIAESLGLVESYTYLHNKLFTIAESLNVVEIKAYVQKKWSNLSKSTVAVVSNTAKAVVAVITNRPKS